MSKPILQALGLHYRYTDGYTVLNDLTLTVPDNGRLAVLGANGAGKTTLLLLLSGVLRPDRGEIRLEGRPLDYSRRGVGVWRQEIGVVLQDPDDQLFAATVYQDVSFGPLNLGLPLPVVRERVGAALAALDIADLADRPTHALSFGQRKRVAIAGVLAMGPRLMFLDEPTAGLDPRGTQQLLLTLEQLHLTGTSLVLVTHDIDLAYGWAGEVAVLNRGTVARQGPPAEVLMDRALLAAGGLRPPWVLEVGFRLRDLGWLAPGVGLPRTQGELLERLARVVRSEGGGSRE